MRPQTICCSFTNLREATLLVGIPIRLASKLAAALVLVQPIASFQLTKVEWLFKSANLAVPSRPLHAEMPHRLVWRIRYLLIPLCNFSLINIHNLQLSRAQLAEEGNVNAMCNISRGSVRFISNTNTYNHSRPSGRLSFDRRIKTKFILSFCT